MPMSQKGHDQCIRHSYDETNEALKVSSATPLEVNQASVANTVLQDEITAADPDTSAAVDISNYSKVYVSIIATGLDAAGTVQYNLKA